MFIFSDCLNWFCVILSSFHVNYFLSILIVRQILPTYLKNFYFCHFSLSVMCLNIPCLRLGVSSR